MRHFYGVLLLAFITLYSCKTGPSNQKYSSTVTTIQLDSKVLGRTVAANLYKPLNQGIPLENTPLLYLLHGHGGDHYDWFKTQEGNVAHLLDSLIIAGLIPPITAISLNANNSWYVDRQEAMQAFYTQEVFTYFNSEKHNTPKVDLNRQLIAGNSAGGYGALRFSLLEPERFKAVFLLSPAAYDPLPPAISSSRKIPVFAKDSVFNDSIWQAYNYPKLMSSLVNTKTLPAFYLSTGAQDAYNITPVVNKLKERLDAGNIKSELTIIPGGHDWTVWRRNFTANIIAYFNDFDDLTSHGD